VASARLVAAIRVLLETGAFGGRFSEHSSDTAYPRSQDMPGKKMRSIKKKGTYEALKRKGMPKSRAAAISNAQAKKK
jgi:hypothetical protein